MKTDVEIIEEINSIKEERKVTSRNIKDFGKKYRRLVEYRYFYKSSIIIKTLEWVLEQNKVLP